MRRGARRRLALLVSASCVAIYVSSVLWAIGVKYGDALIIANGGTLWISNHATADPQYRIVTFRLIWQDRDIPVQWVPRYCDGIGALVVKSVGVPLWPLVVGAILSARWCRKNGATVSCSHCGYELSGLQSDRSGDVKCPECGREQVGVAAS